jgi:multiple RNA-binding domain-containing protein 1
LNKERFLGTGLQSKKSTDREIIEKDEIAEKIDGIKDIIFDNNISDMDYLKSHIVKNNEREIIIPGEENENSTNRIDDETRSNSTIPDAYTTLAETGRLFVRNLPFSVTEDELKSFFGKFGSVAEITLPRDREGNVRGFAMILYAMPEFAVSALAATDHKTFQGRLLHVLPGKPPRDFNIPRPSEGPTSSFKTKKEEKRRQNAGNEFEKN